MRKANKLIILPLLGLMFIWLAVAPPDTFSQTTARAYGSVTESGDMLLLIHYNIDYNTCCPAESEVDTVIAAWLWSRGYRDVSNRRGSYNRGDRME